jgi:SnoaL-like domain
MDELDILRIMQVVSLYGHAADAPELGLLPEVFTATASIDCRPIGGDLIVGRAAIQSWFELGKPPHPPAHYTANTVVQETEDGVRALSKWFVFNPTDGTAATGDYADVLARTPKGWRIERRVITVRGPSALDFSRTRAAQLAQPPIDT